MLIFLIFILILLGIFGFIFIRDLLFLIRFFKEQRQIHVYNKKFKKYQDDKKRLLDQRLQQEKQLKEEYGLDYIQEQNAEIVGFVEPVGEHSQKEFKRNYEKYSRIMIAAKSGESTYWKNMVKIANAVGRHRGRSRE